MALPTTALSRCLLAPFLLLAICQIATAQSGFFINAALGDDANSGQSETQPLRTITRAIQLSGPDTSAYVIAPGVYDNALGESFPLRIRGGISIYASFEGGPSIDIVASPGEDAVIIETGPFGDAGYIWNVRVQGARTGFAIKNSETCLLRCDVIGCETGVDIDAQFGGEHRPPLLSGCRIANCDVGVRADSVTGLHAEWFTRIESCRTGLDYIARGSGFGLLSGGWTVHNCTTGIRYRDRPNSDRLSFAGVITGCDVGIDLDSTGTILPKVNLFQVTLADCMSGLVVRSAMDPGSTIVRSIIANNASDAPLGLNGIVVADSIVSSGALTGSGVAAVDPMFENPSAGDFSLQRSSPAIDFLASANDGTGWEFADGNLDTRTGVDVGGAPFQTLSCPTLSTLEIFYLVPSGTMLDFVVRGEPGSQFVIAMSAESASGSREQVRTRYGTFWDLSTPPQRIIAGSIPQGSDRATVQLDTSGIPSSVTFQALVESNTSPSGLAFSNPISLQVVQP